MTFNQNFKLKFIRITTIKETDNMEVNNTMKEDGDIFNIALGQESKISTRKMIMKMFYKNIMSNNNHFLHKPFESFSLFCNDLAISQSFLICIVFWTLVH